MNVLATFVWDTSKEKDSCQIEEIHNGDVSLFQPTSPEKDPEFVLVSHLEQDNNKSGK